MAVERLAIIEGPLEGVEENTGDALAKLGAWMRSHDVRPSWVIAGAIAGAIAARGPFDGALKGALIAAAASWGCARACER